MRELYALAFRLAKEFIDERRRSDPFWGQAQAIIFGGGSDSTDTSFKREGTGAVNKSYSLPAALSALIEQAYTSSPVGADLAGAEHTFLLDLFQKAGGAIPGLNILQSLQALDPTNFSGSGALATQAARNPYSTDYETATTDLYNRQVNQARSKAQSGPTNVRGAQARQGFELADVDSQMAMNRYKEINAQQGKEAGIVQNAVQLSNMIENLRRGSQLQAQQQNMGGETAKAGMGEVAEGGMNKLKANNSANLALAGDLLGQPKQTTVDSFKGKGNQIGQHQNWEAGVSCCFIFLEALNGELPLYVRRGRDEFNTPNRRRGYVHMSRWLVPLMRRSHSVRKLVNMFMVRPFLMKGRSYYDHKGMGWLLSPVCWSWFWTWSILGKFTKD